jgi:hypothetical protein
MERFKGGMIHHPKAILVSRSIVDVVLPLSMETNMPKVERKPQLGKKTIQSYVFPGSWTRERVVSWLEKHGAFTGGIDLSVSVWRARQYNPEDFVPHSFRMIAIGSQGVRAVNGMARSS